MICQEHFLYLCRTNILRCVLSPLVVLLFQEYTSIRYNIIDTLVDKTVFSDFYNFFKMNTKLVVLIQALLLIEFVLIVWRRRMEWCNSYTNFETNHTIVYIVCTVSPTYIYFRMNSGFRLGQRLAAYEDDKATLSFFYEIYRVKYSREQIVINCVYMSLKFTP